MAPLSWLLLGVACGPSPDGGDPSATDTEASGTTGEGTTADDGADETGPPSFPSPDCSTLVFPGDPADVLATPREDHDAEVLALAVDPSLLVAPQARYETVSADLAAIRALDPSLAEIHTGCVFPNGIQFWTQEDITVIQAISLEQYHAWDCINAYYGVTRVQRIDGLAVAIELDGVYDRAIQDQYAALPGLGNNEDYWFSRDDWFIVGQWDECEATAGEITLEATLLEDGSLDERLYRFVSTTDEVTQYRVVGTDPPVLVE